MMLHHLRVLSALATLGVIMSGCHVLERAPDLPVEQESIACFMDEAALVGTWQTATVCNWAWGDGCRTIPVAERRTSLTFRDDGTCCWAEDNVPHHEAEYRLVPLESRMGPQTSCLLEIGGMEGYQTWSFTFASRDTLTLGILAKDAGITLYVRAY